MILFELLKFT